jgi:hypothetical protein
MGITLIFAKNFVNLTNYNASLNIYNIIIEYIRSKSLKNKEYGE